MPPTENISPEVLAVIDERLSSITSSLQADMRSAMDGLFERVSALSLQNPPHPPPPPPPPPPHLRSLPLPHVSTIFILALPPTTHSPLHRNPTIT
ncbi:mediator of RNA polymerase II transcription subunit 10-like [Lotus japonicus]|uniref:mediator of RNA polymerase II transcription subunit 10-like n=1 Tax=Lotus japonicus TaxID=34305 RepID=UPI0025873FBD|nr:mediator of RNA polymerase II transcription subunit 10-like [Lotus japonicus]